jgi:hypothetical protein
MRANSDLMDWQERMRADMEYVTRAVSAVLGLPLTSGGDDQTIYLANALCLSASAHLGDYCALAGVYGHLMSVPQLSACSAACESMSAVLTELGGEVFLRAVLRGIDLPDTLDSAEVTRMLALTHGGPVVPGGGPGGKG